MATTAVSSALQVGGEDVMGSYASIYVDLSTGIWTSLGSGEGQRETAPGETNRRSTVGEDGTALCCVQIADLSALGCWPCRFLDVSTLESSCEERSRYSPGVQLLLSGSLDRGTKSTIPSGLYEGHSTEYGLLYCSLQ